MITIYHLATSRSERVIWLMEELGLQYNLERFAREPNMMAPPALREIHPLGKSPTIRDGDTVLVESGAILEYIIHRHGQGRLAVPVNSTDYPRYVQWMHFAEGSAMTQLLLHLFLGGMIPGVDQSSPMVAMMKDRTTIDAALYRRRVARAPVVRGRILHRGRHHDGLSIRTRDRLPETGHEPISKHQSLPGPHGPTPRVQKGNGDR